MRQQGTSAPRLDEAGEPTFAPVIECLGVRHAFVDRRTKAHVEALEAVDVVVQRQEFVGIVGPSGCGKTTLLNMIAGLLQPTEGTVRVDGEPVRGVHASNLGYMFARDNLFPWRTVRKNVELGLELSRASDRRQRAQSYVDLVGLAGFEDHYPHQLSQGMRQRVSLARTLVREPSIVLMDEPFGALDAQTRVLMQNEFLDLWERSRSTVVLVTHDIAEAIALSDRVVVFSRRPGRIIGEYRVDLPRPRPVDELHADPAFQELYTAIWNDLKGEIRPV
jgi:NitT/TauT family transport system ATP-binding protein